MSTPSTQDRHELCAALVLSSADDGPAALGVFTDEELTALDGLDTPQIVPMPWLVDSEDTVDARTAASIALRSLLARRLVVPAELLADDWEELGDDPRRLYAVDPVQGLLTLRRGFSTVITLQRLVTEQIHTIVQYGYDGATVLEEEVTADGYHHFFALPRDVAVDHAIALIDQDGVASEDGEPVSLLESQLAEDQQMIRLLGDTRALTVASVITSEGDAEQLTFYATSDRLIVSRSTDDVTGRTTVEDPEIDLVPVSPASLRDVVRALLDTATA